MIGNTQHWDIGAEAFSELLARREEQRLADLRCSERIGLRILQAMGEESTRTGAKGEP